jgi:hypothetical protein
MALTRSTAASIFSPEGNSLAVFIDVTDGELKLKDVFGDILPFSTIVGGGGLNLQNDALMTSTLTPIVDKDNTSSALSISTEGGKITSSQSTAFEIETSTTGAVLSLSDDTTSDNTQVGVGAIGDVLILKGGSNTLGTVQISGTQVDCQLNSLRNFIPTIQQQALNLVIDSNNEQTYDAAVMQVTGALTITIDSSVANGFNMSIIQMDANQTTIATSGALNLRNRQGHTQTAGQYSVITLLKNTTNLFLAGDTA